LAPNAYMAVQGDLVYTQRPISSMVDEDESTDVPAGTWMCEAALWVRWRHVGQMTATNMCRIMAINAEALIAVVMSSSGALIKTVTMTYAKNYHQRVVMSSPPNSHWPSDLQVPFTEPTDLLSSDSEMQLLDCAVRHNSVTLTDQQRETLVQDLQEGKCSLQPSEDNGGLVVVVSLVALKVQRSSGDMFVQLGRLDKTGARGCCQLPGSKRRRGEIPHLAVERVLASELVTFQGRLAFEEFEQEVERRTSSRYGLPTTYFRAIRVAWLNDEDEDIDLWTARLDLSKLGDEAAQHLGELVTKAVYMVPDGPLVTEDRKVLLFTWVTPDEFEFLKDSDNRGVLHEWLNAMDIWPDMERASI